MPELALHRRTALCAGVEKLDVRESMSDHRSPEGRYQSNDPIRERDGLLQIMRYEKHSHSGLSGQLQHFVLRSLSGHRIERTEWFIHQHDARHRAICSRCCMPPDIREGYLSAWAPRPIVCSRRLISAGMSARGLLQASIASSTFLAALRHGSSARP